MPENKVIRKTDKECELFKTERGNSTAGRLFSVQEDVSSIHNCMTFVILLDR